MQRFVDEFQFPNSGRVQNILTATESASIPEVTDGEALNSEEHIGYRTAVDKLLHVCSKAASSRRWISTTPD